MRCSKGGNAHVRLTAGEIDGLANGCEPKRMTSAWREPIGRATKVRRMPRELDGPAYRITKNEDGSERRTRLPARP